MERGGGNRVERVQSQGYGRHTLEQGSCPPHRVLKARLNHLLGLDFDLSLDVPSTYQGKQATFTGGLINFLRTRRGSIEPGAL